MDEANLHAVDPRDEAVEGESSQAVDLGLETPGRPVRDDPGPGEVWFVGRHMSQHPQPASDLAFPDLEVDLGPACLVQQALLLRRDGAGTRDPRLQVGVVDERRDEPTPDGCPRCPLAERTTLLAVSRG